MKKLDENSSFKDLLDAVNELSKAGIMNGFLKEVETPKPPVKERRTTSEEGTTMYVTPEKQEPECHPSMGSFGQVSPECVEGKYAHVPCSKCGHAEKPTKKDIGIDSDGEPYLKKKDEQPPVKEPSLTEQVRKFQMEHPIEKSFKYEPEKQEPECVCGSKDCFLKRCGDAYGVEKPTKKDELKEDDIKTYTWCCGHMKDIRECGCKPKDELAERLKKHIIDQIKTLKKG